MDFKSYCYNNYIIKNFFEKIKNKKIKVKYAVICLKYTKECNEFMLDENDCVNEKDIYDELTEELLTFYSNSNLSNLDHLLYEKESYEYIEKEMNIEKVFNFYYFNKNKFLNLSLLKEENDYYIVNDILMDICDDYKKYMNTFIKYFDIEKIIKHFNKFSYSE